MSDTKTIVIVSAVVFLGVFFILYRAGSFGSVEHMDWKSKWFGRFNLKFFRPKNASVEKSKAKPAVQKRKNEKDEPTNPEVLGEFHNKVGNLMDHRPKGPSQADIAAQERELLDKGIRLFKEKKNVEAKKCFDTVVQRNPSSVEGKYWLARVLEDRKELAPASKFFWEAAKDGKGSEIGRDARDCLNAIVARQRLRVSLIKAIKLGQTKESIWFDSVPNAQVLAECFAAFSNNENGGNIIIGLDLKSKTSLRPDFEEFHMICEVVTDEYLTAPCFFEVLVSRDYPVCIFIEFHKGLNIPYRVMRDKDSDAADIFVLSDTGVRVATEAENNELRNQKRG